MYIMLTHLYFFVWNPGFDKFFCVSNPEIPPYYADIRILEAALKGDPEDAEKAQELSMNIIKFLRGLPGEGSAGAVVIEGPFHVGETAAKFSEWKLSTNNGTYESLNTLLTNLDIGYADSQ